MRQVVSLHPIIWSNDLKQRLNRWANSRCVIHQSELNETKRTLSRQLVILSSITCLIVRQISQWREINRLREVNSVDMMSPIWYTMITSVAYIFRFTSVGSHWLKCLSHTSVCLMEILSLLNCRHATNRRMVWVMWIKKVLPVKKHRRLVKRLRQALRLRQNRPRSRRLRKAKWKWHPRRPPWRPARTKRKANDNSTILSSPLTW